MKVILDAISKDLGFSIFSLLISILTIPVIIVKVGAEVELFGVENSVFQMSSILDTIPYEVISGISSRVQRIYLEE